MSNSVSFRVGGVPEHFNLPWHLALENGAFKAAGVDVVYVDYPDGTGSMTRGLRDGELDIALVLFEGAVAHVLRGNAIKIVKVYVQSPLIWGIHVAAKSQFKNIEDIQGKRYAISRNGSGSHLMAIVDAAERGWDTADMEFVKVGGLSGARRALPDGEADAFLWERTMTQPFVDSGEFRRVGERWVPWPAFVVAVREDVLEKRADEVRKVFEVIDTQCQSLMDDPHAVELISERYELDPAQTQDWFNHVRWHIGFDQPTKDLELVIDYLEKVGIVDSVGAKPDDIWRSLDQQQPQTN